MNFLSSFFYSLLLLSFFLYISEKYSHIIIQVHDCGQVLYIHTDKKLDFVSLVVNFYHTKM